VTTPPVDCIRKLVKASSIFSYFSDLKTILFAFSLQIAQFKHILGVKPAPQNALSNVPVKTYSRSLELPKEFDARSAWSRCSTIGNILGRFIWLTRCILAVYLF
jgi:hypothetical protein